MSKYGNNGMHNESLKSASCGNSEPRWMWRSTPAMVSLVYVRSEQRAVGEEGCGDAFGEDSSGLVAADVDPAAIDGEMSLKTLHKTVEIGHVSIWE